MAKFDVYVERRYFVGDIIKGVEADTKEEAEAKALELFPHPDFYTDEDKLMSQGGGYIDSYTDAQPERHFD